MHLLFREYGTGDTGVHSGIANLPIGGLSNPKAASIPEADVDAQRARVAVEQSLSRFSAAAPSFAGCRIALPHYEKCRKACVRLLPIYRVLTVPFRRSERFCFYNNAPT
jgi:hypothetical protein